MSKKVASRPVLGDLHHNDCWQAQENALQAAFAWGKSHAPLSGLSHMCVFDQDRGNPRPQ